MLILLLLFRCEISASPFPTLNPDPHFDASSEYWRPYSVFHKADKVADWNVTFPSGRAVITGNDCQPQARVGFRSLPIPLLPGGTGVYRIEIDWQGRGIHRAGAFVLLVDADERVLRQAILQGPAGAFAETRTDWIAVQEADWSASPSLLLYAFHDGIGTLEVSRFAIVECESADFRSLPPVSRKARALSRVVEPLGASTSEAGSLFPVQSVPLLAGERRHFSSVLAGESPTTATIESRVVALQWEFGTQARAPFWLVPGTAGGDVFGLEDSAALPALPPLPNGYGAYLHFYGKYRYGKTPADLEQDRRWLREMRSDGFTGAIFWDDYGLDFGRWQKGESLDPTYLLTAAGLHREAGFPSPMIYVLFAGIDRGHVLWEKDDAAAMAAYVKAIEPHLAAAEAIVGKGRLVIAPFDEPDDPDRQEAAVEIARTFLKNTDFPLAASVNWQTANRLEGLVRPIVGAGDYPSFDAARSSGAWGSYCGLDSSDSPLRFRYLAGVHAWASGLQMQAYWHHLSVSGEPASDLDGQMRDYMTVSAEAGNTTGAVSLARIQLSEGLQDLRLLLALEAASKSAEGERARKLADFLTEIRSRALTSDRLGAEWTGPQEYERIRGTAVLLLFGGKTGELERVSEREMSTPQ